MPRKARMVPRTGLEPARYCYRRHLKPVRLPMVFSPKTLLSPPLCALHSFSVVGLGATHISISLTYLILPRTGLEPAQYCYRRHLKPVRLPISPPRRINFQNTDIVSSLYQNNKLFQSLAVPAVAFSTSKR